MKWLALVGVTPNEQENDRANILMQLEEIDPMFLDFKTVDNLTIDFTEGYTSSINAQVSVSAFLY